MTLYQNGHHPIYDWHKLTWLTASCSSLCTCSPSASGGTLLVALPGATTCSAAKDTTAAGELETAAAFGKLPASEEKSVPLSFLRTRSITFQARPEE
jgi:hypothetical protein